MFCNGISNISQNFPEYKKYANTELGTLAFYMGIQDITAPIQGTDKDIKLSKIDIEEFLSNDFIKIFGIQYSIPFNLDAETSISEDFGNDTIESMISQVFSNCKRNSFYFGFSRWWWFR